MLSIRLLLCSSLPLLAGCATLWPWGGPRGPYDELLATPLPADTTVVMGALPNGLRYYIRANAEPDDRAELRLVVNAGSVLEDADQQGLAHVVEHMAFNGTRNFEKHELVDYLERIGMRFGPDINAYTSFDETVYTLTVPTDSVAVMDTAFQILEDWAHGVTFDSVEVAKERGVVIEEWRLGQGAAARMRNRQFPVLLRSSRYARRLPIGTRETLDTFQPAELKRFYEDWYRPELMAIVAVGDFDPARIERMIRRHFADIPRSEKPRKRGEFRIPQHRNTLISVATDPEATASTVTLYLKRTPRAWSRVADFQRWLTESLAASMLNNRLVEHTQKPDAPFLNVSSFHGRFLRPVSAFIVSATVPEGHVGRGLGALLTEVERVSQHGFTASELEREKAEMSRMLERQFTERSKEPSGAFAAGYVSHFLYGGAMLSPAAQFELAQRLLPGITTRAVDDVAEQWRTKRNRVILVAAPDEEEVVVPTVRDLARVANGVRERAVRAYRDDVSSAPLVRRPPEPGHVVSEWQVPEIGVTEWKLSNGARVILKPTDFKNDEILLAGRSPGGTSLVSDADYIAGLTAAAAVQVGGLGDFDITTLQKRLAGTAASVGTSISDLHETVSGAASPQDAALLFRLLYLKFTAPRVDTVAFQAYREQAKAALRNRGASPEANFADTLQVTLAQGHPRAQPPSAEMFDHLDLARSVQIYRDRFADAGDFTFFVVGSFQVDSIRPLVEQYIGGLPATGRNESWRDLGIETPPGVVRKQVTRGAEPKARTQIVFSGPMEFARDSLYLLSALSEVLEIRLRDRLREEMSGTYGASVSANAGRIPKPEYRFSISFGASPERLDELVAEVFAQIDSLKLHGATALEVEKVREMQRRSREVQLRENHFWLRQLMSYDSHDWALSAIAAAPEPGALTPDGIRAAARQFLNTARYVQVSLVPEPPPAS